MASFVTSVDGTRIAFDRFGQGPPVVVVGGLLCDRERTQELAEQLAQHLSVINYDRRGRGESGDTAPYSVEREVEDLAALIAEAGGAASVYGHSSGAGLALAAAASGLPVTRLVLHEPPYGSDDEESQRAARELAESVRAAVAADRRVEAIRLFMQEAGMPPEMVEGMASDPKMLALAPTMPYDHDVMGDFSRGGTVPEHLVRGIATPTLVIAGGASPEFFLETAAQIAELLPNGKYTVLEGQDHGAPAEVVAPVVAEFLTASSCRQSAGCCLRPFCRVRSRLLVPGDELLLDGGGHGALCSTHRGGASLPVVGLTEAGGDGMNARGRDSSAAGTERVRRFQLPWRGVVVLLAMIMGWMLPSSIGSAQTSGAQTRACSRLQAALARVGDRGAAAQALSSRLQRLGCTTSGPTSTSSSGPTSTLVTTTTGAPGTSVPGGSTTSSVFAGTTVPGGSTTTTVPGGTTVPGPTTSIPSPSTTVPGGTSPPPPLP